MPILQDPKREKFAQLLARGIPTIDAYVRAGYKRNTGNATALKKKPDMVARVEELQFEMSLHTEAELNDFLRDTKLSPTYIVRALLETAKEAKDAQKFDIAAKCYKDLGGELFGMFVERKHLSVDKQSVHSETNTTINIENLNQALEALGGIDTKVPQIEGHAECLDVLGTGIPRATITSDK